MSATPLLYTYNTSTLANYLSIPEKKPPQNADITVAELLRYSKYPHEQELSLDQFKEVAKFC